MHVFFVVVAAADGGGGGGDGADQKLFMDLVLLVMSNKINELDAFFCHNLGERILRVMSHGHLFSQKVSRAGCPIFFRMFQPGVVFIR